MRGITVKANDIEIHLIRISMQLTMNEVANISGLSRTTIRTIEQGKPVSSLSAMKLSNAYDIDMLNYFTLVEYK